MPLVVKFILEVTEWIFIPAVYETERLNRDEKLQPKRTNNDIHAIKELIDGLGLYEYALMKMV